jgi:hypothetical protein
LQPDYGVLLSPPIPGLQKFMERKRVVPGALVGLIQAVISKFADVLRLRKLQLQHYYASPDPELCDVLL